VALGRVVNCYISRLAETLYDRARATPSSDVLGTTPCFFHLGCSQRYADFHLIANLERFAEPFSLSRAAVSSRTNSSCVFANRQKVVVEMATADHLEGVPNLSIRYNLRIHRGGKVLCPHQCLVWRGGGWPRGSARVHRAALGRATRGRCFRDWRYCRRKQSFGQRQANERNGRRVGGVGNDSKTSKRPQSSHCLWQPHRPSCHKHQRRFLHHLHLSCSRLPFQYHPP
jgi:hypothetical protein